jgi:hypothetical protein
VFTAGRLRGVEFLRQLHRNANTLLGAGAEPVPVDQRLLLGGQQIDDSGKAPPS